ncbi:uncharacterized protein STEHIDRAFT_168488 [Stereum hirsutum FP-91666 SS1]|uniref:uncharacterized protein n=1 Tax=Stereum hirsutum (strain FP-91666) TaxID=721885 RepID=UPI000440A961|nr:uncharacterized protein STEHIDRAFT_168488 [Stereum hirsutum FP-91666 SS1]EIM86511.1 hypothetical protein STEHIDRAFT_168488 [Stereum hirsutum FP-91666 SS1]
MSWPSVYNAVAALLHPITILHDAYRNLTVPFPFNYFSAAIISYFKLPTVPLLDAPATVLLIDAAPVWLELDTQPHWPEHRSRGIFEEAMEFMQAGLGNMHLRDNMECIDCVSVSGVNALTIIVTATICALLLVAFVYVKMRSTSNTSLSLDELIRCHLTDTSAPATDFWSLNLAQAAHDKDDEPERHDTDDGNKSDTDDSHGATRSSIEVNINVDDASTCVDALATPADKTSAIDMNTGEGAYSEFTLTSTVCQQNNVDVDTYSDNTSSSSSRSDAVSNHGSSVMDGFVDATAEPKNPLSNVGTPDADADADLTTLPALETVTDTVATPTTNKALHVEVNVPTDADGLVVDANECFTPLDLSSPHEDHQDALATPADTASAFDTSIGEGAYSGPTWTSTVCQQNNVEVATYSDDTPLSSPCSEAASSHRSSVVDNFVDTAAEPTTTLGDVHTPDTVGNADLVTSSALETVTDTVASPTADGVFDMEITANVATDAGGLTVDANESFAQLGLSSPHEDQRSDDITFGAYDPRPNTSDVDNSITFDGHGSVVIVDALSESIHDEMAWELTGRISSTSEDSDVVDPADAEVTSEPEPVAPGQDVFSLDHVAPVTGPMNSLEAEPVVAHNAQEPKPDATLVPEPASEVHSTVAEVVVQDVSSVESMSEPDCECTPGPILEDASLPLDGNLTDVQSSAENGGSTLEAVDVPSPCDLSSDFPTLEVLTLGPESEPSEALEINPEDVADDEPTEEGDITDMHSSANQTPNLSSSDVSIEEAQDEVQPSEEDSQDDVLMDEALVAEQDLTDIELASLDDVEENTLNPADLPLPASPASTHSSEDCVLEDTSIPPPSHDSTTDTTETTALIDTSETQADHLTIPEDDQMSVCDDTVSSDALADLVDSTFAETTRQSDPVEPVPPLASPVGPAPLSPLATPVIEIPELARACGESTVQEALHSPTTAPEDAPTLVSPIIRTAEPIFEGVSPLASPVAETTESLGPAVEDGVPTSSPVLCAVSGHPALSVSPVVEIAALTKPAAELIPEPSPSPRVVAEQSSSVASPSIGEPELISEQIEDVVSESLPTTWAIAEDTPSLTSPVLADVEPTESVVLEPSSSPCASGELSLPPLVSPSIEAAEVLSGPAEEVVSVPSPSLPADTPLPTSPVPQIIQEANQVADEVHSESLPSLTTVSTTPLVVALPVVETPELLTEGLTSELPSVQAPMSPALSPLVASNEVASERTEDEPESTLLTPIAAMVDIQAPVSDSLESSWITVPTEATTDSTPDSKTPFTDPMLDELKICGDTESVVPTATDTAPAPAMPLDDPTAAPTMDARALDLIHPLQVEELALSTSQSATGPETVALGSNVSTPVECPKPSDSAGSASASPDRILSPDVPTMSSPTTDCATSFSPASSTSSSSRASSASSSGGSYSSSSTNGRVPEGWIYTHRATEGDQKDRICTSAMGCPRMEQRSPEDCRFGLWHPPVVCEMICKGLHCNKGDVCSEEFRHNIPESLAKTQPPRTVCPHRMPEESCPTWPRCQYRSHKTLEEWLEEWEAFEKEVYLWESGDPDSHLRWPSQPKNKRKHARQSKRAPTTRT